MSKTIEIYKTWYSRITRRNRICNQCILSIANIKFMMKRRRCYPVRPNRPETNRIKFAREKLPFSNAFKPLEPLMPLAMNRKFVAFYSLIQRPWAQMITWVQTTNSQKERVRWWKCSANRLKKAMVRRISCEKQNLFALCGRSLMRYSRKLTGLSLPEDIWAFHWRI